MNNTNISTKAIIAATALMASVLATHVAASAKAVAETSRPTSAAVAVASDKSQTQADRHAAEAEEASAERRRLFRNQGTSL